MCNFDHRSRKFVSSSIKSPSRSRDGEHNVADITGDKLTHDQAEDKSCEDLCSLSGPQLKWAMKQQWN